MDVTNSSIHTEVDGSPWREPHLTAGWLGPLCSQVAMCSCVMLLQSCFGALIYLIKLSVNSSCLPPAHLLPSARLRMEHRVKERELGWY